MAVVQAQEALLEDVLERLALAARAGLEDRVETVLALLLRLVGGEVLVRIGEVREGRDEEGDVARRLSATRADQEGDVVLVRAGRQPRCIDAARPVSRDLELEVRP